MISHMSPRAAWALKMLGQLTRRRDRAPFVGKSYFIASNISERAQHGISLAFKEARTVVLGTAALSV
jgi:hypothetical protein